MMLIALPFASASKNLLQLNNLYTRFITMRPLSLLLVLLLLLSCPSCKRAPSRAERVYKQALEFKDADQTESALQYLRRAIELDPTFEDPYLDLASIYESAGDYNNAIEWYQKYLQVTKDPRMKQLAQNWLADVRALAAEQAGQPAGSPAKPAAPATPAAASELVSAAIAKEREQLQREFSAREKNLAQQHERALNDLKDELRKLKTANTELQDKVDQLAQERDSLAERLKKAGNLKDIADVFSNPSYAPTDRERELTQMLADARKEADQWRASVQNIERTAQQNAEQLVRVRQQLAEAQRGIILSPTGDASSAQLIALRSENAELKRKLDALQSSASSAAAAQSAARAGLPDLSEEITKMQQTIEMQKALLARRDAKIAQLEAAASAAPLSSPSRSSDANLKELIDELNRQLLAKDKQIAALEASLRTAPPASPSYDLSAELQRKDQLLREYAARIQQLERQQYAYTDTTPAAPPPSYQPYSTPVSTPSTPPLYQPIGYNDSYRSAPASPATTAPTSPTTSYTPPPPRTAAPAAPSTAQRTPTRPPRAYRVRRGDSLASIAQNVYGDRNKWNIIFAANRDILRRADYLREGQILYIPPQ